jgi:SHS2 domain-containing protein
MERKFRYLPHTADIAFAAYGKTLETALENSAEALLNIMLDTNKIKVRRATTRSVSIKESASNIENLVWYTLQDILTQIDKKKLTAFKFQLDTLSQNKDGRFSISGKLLFKKIKENLFLLEVKAVTPHDLSVKKIQKGYEIRVLVDV